MRSFLAVGGWAGCFEPVGTRQDSVSLRGLFVERLGAVRPAVHELVRDLKTNLTYLDRTAETESYESAFLIGGGAVLPGAREQLSSTLRIEMEDLSELRNMTVSPQADVEFVRANIGRLAVAIGTGLGGLGKDVTGVTFVPKGEVRAARFVCGGA